MKTMSLGQLFTIFFTCTLLLLVALGIQAWTGPTAAPPGNNVPAPVNVGTVDQIKDAGLGLNKLAVFGNTLLGGSRDSNAYLNFGDVSGAGGYGIRDNNGVIECKNREDSEWVSCVTPNVSPPPQPTPPPQKEVCTITTVYEHPSKTCSNSSGDTCTTPQRDPTDNPYGTDPNSVAQHGCSKGYWSGPVNYCWGNYVNGVCPINWANLGTWDEGGPRVSGWHEWYLFCYPQNIKKTVTKCMPASQ